MSEPVPRPGRLVVIGGGASGVLVIPPLLRALRAPAEIRVLEPRECLGDGLAYGTRESCHVLNVAAARMGAFPERVEDFHAWLNSAGRAAGAGDFVSRAHYGDYLRDRLNAALEDAPGGTSLRHERVRAVDVLRAGGGWRVVDELQSCRDADAVVLATGHVPAPPPARWHTERLAEAWIASPWDASGLEPVQPDEEVLLLGTGLTAVDAVLSLSARGHRGRMHAVSPHGLWPLVHLPEAPASPAAVVGMSLRACVRAVRRQARDQGARAAVDALRASTPALWAAFTEQERRRFLRHLRTAWDVHRHRVAPESATVIERLREAGRLTVQAGQVRSLEPGAEGGVVATVVPRGGGQPGASTFHRVICCLGVTPMPPANPVLGSLLARGVLVPDSLGLGPILAIDGSVPGAPGLYAAGPLRRGRDWESTAIPEIRAQAAQLAPRLVQRLGAT